MASKDFQELIKAQQETTKAMMSAEDAAKYDAILAERKLEFDKKSEAVKKGIETKKETDAADGRKQAAADAESAKTDKEKSDQKLFDITNKPAFQRTNEEQGEFLKENNRKIEEKAKEDKVNFKDTKTWQKNQAAIGENNLKLREQSAGKDISGAAQKEIDDERTKLQEKNQGLLGKIAGGLGGLLKQGKDKVVAAAKGIFGFIKGLAIAGLGLALVAFLNSPLWEDTKTYIVKTLIPTLGRFYDAFFGPKGGFMEGFKALFGDESGLGYIVLAIGTVVAGLVAFKIVSIVSAIISSITAIKLAFTTMKAQFLLTKTGMLAMKAKAILMNAPLLPIIAIAAGIALIIGSLKAALDDFEKTLKEGGSMGAALQAGASKFIGFLVGYPTKLIADLIGWVLNKLGFENVAKKLENFVGVDPIKSITDWVSDLMTTIGKFFDDIFDFDFMSFVKGIPGAGKIMDFLGIGGGDEEKGKGKGMGKAAAQLKYGDAGYGRGKVESKGFLSTIGSMFGSDDEGNLAPVNAVPRQKSKRRLEIERRSAEIIERKKNMSAEQIQSMREMKIAMNTIPAAAPVVVNAPSTNINSNSNSSASYISTPLSNPNPTVNAVNYSF